MSFVTIPAAVYHVRVCCFLESDFLSPASLDDDRPATCEMVWVRVAGVPRS